MVEETEYPKYVASLLNPDFKKTISIFNMLQIRLRHSLQFFNQVKSPDNFILHFLLLIPEEVVKVMLIENDRPLLLLIQVANIKKVAPK